MNKIFYLKTEDFIKQTSLVANFSPSDIYLMTHYALKDKLLPSTKYVSYNEETNIVTFKNLKNNKNIEKNISEVVEEFDDIPASDAIKLGYLKAETDIKQEKKEKEELLRSVK